MIIETPLPDGEDQLPFFASVMMELVVCFSKCKKLQLLSL